MQENVAREAGLLQASFIMKSKQAQVYYNELDYTIARAIFERKEAKVQKKSDYILGLDLGVNSVGWAVVDCADRPIAESGSERRFLPTGLRALNARIFQEMVDAKTRVPKNQKRRQMRGMRRSAAQAKRLRRRLIRQLAENKMLPDGTDLDFHGGGGESNRPRVCGADCRQRTARRPSKNPRGMESVRKNAGVAFRYARARFG